ncbi:MAG TPA: response regulator [Desulfobacteria bacterium]|nr:response regulator [Desulfobacteria bacterium]
MAVDEDYLLVVDDHASVRRLLQAILTEKGYPVIAVGSGEQALAQVRVARPALVLLDVKMPGIDGFETLKRLKTLDSHIPVIVMSAYTELSSVNTARQLGMIEHYLCKPFALEEIYSLVASVLNGREAEGKTEIDTGN